MRMSGHRKELAESRAGGWRMTLWLKSITVADFRSIRGRVTVPLDAPIVLIHGQNGVGKTSILSASELGLTGSVPLLGRVEPEYISHLPHKSAEDGQVSLTVDGLGGPVDTAEMVVTREGIRNSALLTKEQCRFFSE
jgi:DNA repair protein SbcC/Rad50